MKPITLAIALMIAAACFAQEQAAPDLSQLDADTLRTLAKNLFRRVDELTRENNKLKQLIDERKEPVVQPQNNPPITERERRPLTEVEARYIDRAVQQRRELIESLKINSRGNSERLEVLKKQRRAERRSGAIQSYDERISELTERIARDAGRRKELETPDFQFVPTLPRPLSVGDAGNFGWPVRVAQVIDPKNAVIEYSDSTLWLSGFNTSGWTDDTSRSITSPVEITGTKSYTTVLGGQKTVLMVEPFTPPEYTFDPRQ